MEFHLKLIGVLLIILALVHVVFPRYFDWKVQLAALSLVNRQMMLIHTFFIALVLLLMGVLCFFSAEDLAATALGKRVSFGFGVFWLVRLIVQFFGYSPELWRGKRFETGIHILFAITWTYFTSVFFWVYWY